MSILFKRNICLKNHQNSLPKTQHFLRISWCKNFVVFTIRFHKISRQEIRGNYGIIRSDYFMIFSFGIELANTVLAILLRKASNEWFCRFWDKLELDTAELDIDEPPLPLKDKLPGYFDDGTLITTNQQKLCNNFITA